MTKVNRSPVPKIDQFTDISEYPAWMSPMQVHRATGLARNSVYAGIKNGLIPSVRVTSGRILIPRQGLMRILETAMKQRVGEQEVKP